jgi:carbon-monoxide dehydrogenase medium subunit
VSVPAFDYERAVDLHAALAAVANGATPIHGGTELLAAMDLGLLAPEKLVSLRSVEELRVLRVEGRRLIVGAGLTHREVAASPTVRQNVPLLAEVADDVGNVRVRSTGTLGGNLAFAEPRSDITTALLALDAQVRLSSLTGRRQLPLAAFLLGAYEVDLQPGELILAVGIPCAATDFSVYRKIVFSERPVVNVALIHFHSPARWRLVVGAVGLVPLSFEFDRLAHLNTSAILGSLEPTRDLAGREDYKRHLTSVMIGRARAAAGDFERGLLAT